MSTLISMWSDKPIGAGEEEQIFSGKLVKISYRRDGVPLVEIRVGKLTHCVSPNELISEDGNKIMSDIHFIQVIL